MTENIENTNPENRPTHRLIQEKAFFKIDANGRQTRDKETIEITRGWLQKAKESDIHYISWANTAIPVLPDIDGKTTLRTFEINYQD